LDGFLSVEDVLKEELLFKKEDVEVFLSLGRMLGNSDRSDQEKNFKLIFMEIGNLEEEAREEKEKNEKVYKNLGLLFGVALVIILL
jgi:stage III sporulation protein AB